MTTATHTPGPWLVHTVEHPHYLGGSHKERRIITGWDHPQAQGPLVIVGPSIGLGPTKDDKAVHLAGVWSEQDAELIADAPAAKLALDMICAGVARIDGGGFHFAELSFEIGVVRWSAMLDVIGWSRCREALAAARVTV